MANTHYSVCAARVIAISYVRKALCTITTLTAKIILLLYTDTLPRRLTFEMAVNFGLSDRIIYNGQKFQNPFLLD